MTPFFITGLPRSRTAWFANLFTWGDSICYHDFMARFTGTDWPSTVSILLAFLMEKNGVRGHSCASNILVCEDLIRAFPEAKWLILDRDIKKVYESCKILNDGIKMETLSAMSDLCVRISERTNSKFLSVDNLDFESVEVASDFLGVKVGPPDRVAQLLDMNIQIHPPILKRRLCQLSVDTKAA